MKIEWRFKRFNELLPGELYAILQLRNEVFVVEQACVFQDADDKDQDSRHLMGWVQDRLAVYTRVVPPGLAYENPSIGRVVSASFVRRTGAGRLLMEQSIAALESVHGKTAIEIGAQLYLKNFYESFGFNQLGDQYLEDGIPHIHMVRQAPS